MSLLVEMLVEIIVGVFIELIYDKALDEREKRWIRICAAFTLFLCMALIFGAVIFLSIVVIIKGESMGCVIIGIMVLCGFLILKKISKDIKQKQNDKV